MSRQGELSAHILSVRDKLSGAPSLYYDLKWVVRADMEHTAAGAHAFSIHKVTSTPWVLLTTKTSHSRQTHSSVGFAFLEILRAGITLMYLEKNNRRISPSEASRQAEAELWHFQMTIPSGNGGTFADPLSMCRLV